MNAAQKLKLKAHQVKQLNEVVKLRGKELRATRKTITALRRERNHLRETLRQALRIAFYWNNDASCEVVDPGEHKLWELLTTREPWLFDSELAPVWMDEGEE